MFHKLLLIAFLFLSIALFATETISAQDQETPSDSLVSISLKDGTTLTGRIVGQDDVSLKVITPADLAVDVPRSSIISIKPIRGRVVEGRFYRFDPNYSRLMLAPTGRPLRRGEGYFFDTYVLLPGIAWGFTDNVSLMAGFSVVPGVGLGDQLIYLAPRIGMQSSEEFAVSCGALYASAEGGAAGIAFAVASMGPPDKSFTAGIGLGYTKAEGEDFEFGDRPVILLGGNIRLSNSIALVSENWLITGGDFELGNQPFGLAVRFFGERLAADIGAILIGEVIEEGFPIPWLSFTYNFGR